jgi:solute:Na+ symporter, SSS family
MDRTVMTITALSALVGLTLYLLSLLWLGTRGMAAQKVNTDAYFLADRRLQTGVLFFTLIATNLSAFFFLGFAGAGYRIGIAYFPMMALGTGVAALSFGSMGCRVRRITREHNLITPSELIGHLLPGEGPRLLVFLVMVFFTLPYLALQPLGAGYLLESLTGGAVASTDVLQGVLMFLLMLLAFAAVAHGLGGVPQANRALLAQQPTLFTGAGLQGFFTPQMFANYLLLRPLCLPMFPQMMMRFFAAGDDRSLKKSMVLYPVVAGVMFICPVLIGMWGHLAFPDLAGRAADQVMPLMLERFSPQWLTGLVIVGALASFMSTLDSQLLALSSMVTRDLYCRYWRPQASLGEQVRVGQLAVVALAVAGFAIALHPPDAFLSLATHTFSGLAVLFPMLVGAVYGLRWSVAGAMLSVVGAEAVLLGLAMGWIPESIQADGLPLLPALAVACGVLAFDLVIGLWRQGGVAGRWSS